MKHIDLSPYYTDIDSVYYHIIYAKNITMEEFEGGDGCYASSLKARVDEILGKPFSLKSGKLFTANLKLGWRKDEVTSQLLELLIDFFKTHNKIILFRDDDSNWIHYELQEKAKMFRRIKNYA